MQPHETDLAQDWQRETRTQSEQLRGHLLQCGMELRIAARFQRDDEGQSVLVEPRLLQHGVNVQLMSRKDRCKTSDNSGLISHPETQVPGCFKVAAHFRRCKLQWAMLTRPCGQAFRHKHQI